MTEQVVEVEGIAYHTFYTAANNGGNPTSSQLVLLSHALMSNHSMWDATTTALSNAGFSVLSYDHIGHNKTPALAQYTSSLESPAYHFDDFTRHMRELVHAITGQTKVYAVIGCSMGGVLALRYAMLFPEDVKAVISCDAPGMTSLEVAKPMWSERIRKFESDLKTGDDSLARATVERWSPGKTADDEEVRKVSFGHVKTCSLDGYKICADAIRTYDYTGQLGEITSTRCMVLVGSEDSAVGPKEVLEDVARRIPQAKYVCLDGAGHLPPMHKPHEFNKIMLDFLEVDNRI